MRSYIKQHTSRVGDIRLVKLSDNAFRVYWNMYTLAGVLDADGLFIENNRRLSDEEIALRIFCPIPNVLKAMKELKSAKLIHVNGKGPQISDWKNEQVDMNKKRERDKEYQRKHRSIVSDSSGVRPDNSNVSTDGKDVAPRKQEEQLNVVVVVDHVTTEWKELIGDVNASVEKAIQRFASTGVSEKTLLKAVEITADQGKDTAAYFKGVVANLVKGTSKPAKRGAHHAPVKPKPGGRSVKL